jgi:hypothetical protein
VRRDSGKVAIEGDLQRLKEKPPEKYDEETVVRRIKEAYEDGCASVCASEVRGEEGDGWIERWLVGRHSM